jgi:hypothetical protein
MKARAFDDLVKEQYDQGDFAYNPKNWDRLAEQLDKKPNKSKVLLWLPMAAIVSFSSIAASLAMIISLPALVHHKASPHVAAVHKAAAQKGVYIAPAVLPVLASAANQPYNYTVYIPKTITVTRKPESNPFQNLFLGAHNRQLLQNTINKDLHLAETMLKHVYTDDAPATVSSGKGHFNFSDGFYEPEQQKCSPRSSISLLGGLNHGTQSAGYTVGITGKTMISAKVYIEGDLAFVNNSNAGKTEYAVNTLTPTAKLAATTKQLGITGNNNDATAPAPAMASKPTNFGIYYAQFTPTIGYNLRKRISVGMGADMQQLLQNTASATPDVTTDKAIPQFDMGIVAKTEYALSGRIKAGIYYRRGVTNLLLLNDNHYLERNYMQVQVKYSIFNK